MPRSRSSPRNMSASNHARRCWLGKCVTSPSTLRRAVASSRGAETFGEPRVASDLGDSCSGGGGESMRRPQVAVVLGDLVLEDEVVTPRVPRQVGHQPVVLVPVVAVVGE